MSATPYMIPVQGGDSGVEVFHLRNPAESSHTQPPGELYSEPESEGKKKFVSYDTALGFYPGTTTCTSCQQQVVTNVTYKAGRFAWLMGVLFIILGLLLCLFPMIGLFFMKKFKDAYHTCPRCNRVLHIEKRKCK